jgi:hypothetical protein
VIDTEFVAFARRARAGQKDFLTKPEHTATFERRLKIVRDEGLAYGDLAFTKVRTHQKKPSLLEKFEVHKALTTFVFVAILGGAAGLYFGVIKDDRARVPVVQQELIGRLIPLLDSVAAATRPLETAPYYGRERPKYPDGTTVIRRIRRAETILFRELQISSSRIRGAFDDSLLTDLRRVALGAQSVRRAWSSGIDHPGDMKPDEVRVLISHIRTRMGELSR